MVGAGASNATAEEENSLDFIDDESSAPPPSIDSDMPAYEGGDGNHSGIIGSTHQQIV